MRALVVSALLVIRVVLPGSAAASARLDPAVLGNLTWRNIGPALMGGRIADFAVPESDTDVIYVATATGGLWKTVNRGTTWEAVFENGRTASLGDVAVAPSNPNVVQIDPTDPTVVYTESQYGRLVRFDTRTGERRLIQPQPPEGEKYRWRPISPDLTRQLDPYELPLQGRQQPRDAIALHQATADYGNVSTISESKLKQGLLAVGTDDGVVSVSRDDGATWARVDKFPGVPVQTYVSRIAWSGASEGTLYATFDGHRDQNFAPYVLKSGDYGATWTSISSDLPGFGSTKVIAEHPRNPNLLFVGTEFGVFASIDGGTHWTSLKNNHGRGFRRSQSASRRARPERRRASGTASNSGAAQRALREHRGLYRAAYRRSETSRAADPGQARGGARATQSDYGSRPSPPEPEARRRRRPLDARSRTQDQR